MPKGSTIVAVGLGTVIASGIAWFLLRQTGPSYIQNPSGLPCNTNEDCKNPNFGCGADKKCTVHGP